MYKKYKYWEVCQDENETDNRLSISSIWSDEWHSFNDVKNMKAHEVIEMLQHDMKDDLDMRKIKGAVTELSIVINETSMESNSSNNSVLDCKFRTLENQIKDAFNDGQLDSITYNSIQININEIKNELGIKW